MTQRVKELQLPYGEEVSEDWTFQGTQTREGTHCYHDYPARMIPQIARRLLEKYGERAQTLFDPYCGTGTSLVEGRARGLSVSGTDLNPLARLIAAAKTAVVDMERLEAEMCRFDGVLKSLGFGLSVQSPEKPGFTDVAGIDRLEFWFKPQVIEKLAALRAFLESIEDDEVRRFFEVAFSETVRDCSNTRNREFKLYRLAEKDLSPFDPDVYETMRAKLRRNRAGLGDYLKRLHRLPAVGTAHIFDFNTVSGIPPHTVSPGSVDMIVTSPPYGDSGTTVAYGQYSRLSAAWLGLPDPEKVDRRLMGGRGRADIPIFASPLLNAALGAVHIADEKRAREVASFYADLEDSIAAVSPLLRPGGYACYVVGNRRVKGVTLPTHDAVRRAFERHGLHWTDTFTRTIPNKRMPSRNSPTNITGASDSTMTCEYIVVMRS